MNSMMGSSGIAGPTGKVGNKVPTGYKLGQLQQFTPEQNQLFSQLFGLVGPQSYTSRLAGGDESLFNEMEAPALRQFGELQGQLASRFSGMGMGARKGSGFNIAMNQAASDFAQDLASKRQALQRQAILDLMGLSNSLLSQRPYEQFLYEKQKKDKGLFGGFGGIGGAVLGGIGGLLAGSPVQGAMLGYGLGSSIDKPSGGANFSSLLGLGGKADQGYGNLVANYFPGSVI